MDTWVIVLIIIAAIVLVGIIVVGGRRARERQLDSKRSEAAHLRTEADRGTSRAASAPHWRRSRPSRPSRSGPGPRRSAGARTRSIPTETPEAVQGLAVTAHDPRALASPEPFDSYCSSTPCREAAPVLFDAGSTKPRKSRLTRAVS
jgi:FtsZ-interacting cell division protein ZipA